MDLKTLIEFINEKNIEKTKVAISSKQVKVNDYDDNGMTPLQHACFKGALDIVNYLLAMGADVNSNDHKMGYTALMFGALSGNENLVVRLLNAGAKSHRTNSVGRTASQMAAFIGNHRVATIINNYIERSDLAIYIKPDGIKKEVRLQSVLVDPVHRIVNEVNFSPVKVCLQMREEHIIPYWKSIANVLEILSNKFFDPHDTNEGLSIKFFILAVIFRKAGESFEDGDENLDEFIKKLLIGMPPDGLPEGQEKLLRQALKEFPHLESQLYRMIVSQLHKVPLGWEPTTMETLNSRINGQVFFRNPESNPECAACYSMNDTNKRCSKCLQVAYCDINCQKIHWFSHKKFCKILKDKNKRVDNPDIQTAEIELRNTSISAEGDTDLDNSENSKEKSEDNRE